MICFKKNILIALMLIVCVMQFNCVIAPSNEGFWNCNYELEFACRIYGESSLKSDESRINCIRHSILYRTKAETLDSDVFSYYIQFVEHADTDGIQDQKRFCTDMMTHGLEIPVHVKPEELLSNQHLETLRGLQVNPGELISYQQLEALSVRLYIDREDKITECVRKLSIFGNSKENILSSALHLYRVSIGEEEDNYYVFKYGTVRFHYLNHISIAVELKRDSKLDNPWNYCAGRHPDNESENANPVDQASSSNQEIYPGY